LRARKENKEGKEGAEGRIGGGGNEKKARDDVRERNES
jgi:hypothetical protein